MNIFLAPRSNETSYKNFLSSIENGVDYSILEPFLEPEGRAKLKKENRIFAWGTKETKKSSWDKMESGDWVLFYKSGEFVYAGKLYYKQESRDLGLSLWPPKPNEEPWTCIFFLKDLQPIRIPLDEIREAAGYSKGFIVQGFMPLNEGGVESILEKYGTVDNFIKKFSITVDTTEQEEKGVEEVEHVVESELSHTEAEMLLLKIGVLLGYDTYSPNKNISAYNEPLSNYITLSEIPKRFLGDMLNIVSQIDIIWFKDDVPVFAFEVEHTTGVATGVQRLYQ